MRSGGLKKRYTISKVSWSPEKGALSGELEALKRGKMDAATREYVVALQNERGLLLEKSAGPERTARLGYINGRLTERELAQN